MHSGGTERHLLYLLPEMAARGYDITVALLGPGGDLEPRLRALPVRVVSPPKLLRRPLGSLALTALLWREMRLRRPRVVHAFLSEPYLAAALARLAPGSALPALVCGRRSMAFYSASHPLAAAAERWTHGLATALVGNSTAVSGELVSEAGSAEKVATIHNGIPLATVTSPAMRQKARAGLGLRSDAFVMANVAHLAAYKGHADLLDALVIARPELPAGWRMLIAGRDRGESERLIARTHALGLQANVVFLGDVADPDTVFRAADVAVLPSHTEGFSNSLIEGMATGLASVATAAGGNTDAIQDGMNGLIVPPHAPAELAAALLRLWRNPALRQQLAASAAITVMSRYSIRVCADAYDTLWRGLAFGRKGRPADWLLPEPVAIAAPPAKTRPALAS